MDSPCSYGIGCARLEIALIPITERGSEMKITRIGMDLAKQVFVVHGVDERDRPCVRKKLRRDEVRAFFAKAPPCVVAMEACSSSHYWARELQKLGHAVRLIAPHFIKPYRKGQKNDERDAEAICEAAGRPNMRFVPVKSVEQQAVLLLHGTRELLVANRTALVNQIRGFLGEYGIVVSQGVARLRKRMPEILEDAENGLPGLAREVLAQSWARLCELDEQVGNSDRRIAQLARQSEPVQRLLALAGVGPITATAVVANIAEGKLFKNGRQFAAWLGLAPKQHSSGGKTRLGRITRAGNRYLRTLLIHGARAALRHAPQRNDPLSRWTIALAERRGKNKAAVALAAKNARMIWAMLARGEHYRARAA
jgi:transposase